MESQTIGFEYRSLNQVLEISSGIFHFGILQIILFILSIGLICFLVLYGLPGLKIILNEKSSLKIKMSKKQALKQILIQKEIEDEIQKEIEDEKNHKN